MGQALVRDTRFLLGDDQARALAAEFGTPLYVLSEDHLRERARLFVASWPGEVSFASKANSTLAVLKIAHQEGCSIDVASEGELRAALEAGVPASACRAHGNNKSIPELQYAIQVGVGKIVVDCFEEIERLAAMGPTPNLLMRIAPGVDPQTHAKISTGQADTKFGFPLADAGRAVQRCLDLGLPLIGFHCHVGSQLLDAGAQVSGAQAIARFALEMSDKLGFKASFLNVGGGLGVRYTDGSEPMGVAEYCQTVAGALRDTLAGRLDPALGMEPGRAMVAEAGVTVYEVGAVKTAASGRTFVAVDGGLSDNPRPALYGSRYDMVWHSATSGGGARTVTVSGKHCETDTLFPDVEAPEGLAAGDLLQVLCTGAYNSTMASNYNRYPRPATVLVRSNGRNDLVQRRETFEQMFAREAVPSDL